MLLLRDRSYRDTEGLSFVGIRMSVEVFESSFESSSLDGKKDVVKPLSEPQCMG